LSGWQKLVLSAGLSSCVGHSKFRIAQYRRGVGGLRIKDASVSTYFQRPNFPHRAVFKKMLAFPSSGRLSASRMPRDFVDRNKFPTQTSNIVAMKHLLIPFAFFTTIATTGTTFAQEPKQHIDIGKLPRQATLVEDVIVPVPSEIFGVLDKLGSPPWREVLRTDKAHAPGPRPQTALLLGSVIAEGFIAVEAQDAEQVKNIGKSVLDLSKAINVQKAVVARSNAIIEFADKKDWTRVRKELDGALADVKQAMSELHDEELAQLVSLGGWLRGTEALTDIVKRSYSKDSAELLHQPTLLEYFNRRLASMNPRLSSDEVVAKIKQRLPEVSPLIGEAHADISPKSVDQIHAIVAELVKSISSK
jgi:hypothetical protein